MKFLLVSECNRIMILENLTVVMSVYKGDDPKLFKNAVDSVLT